MTNERGTCQVFFVRRQLEHIGDANQTSIIKLAPPLVQTELHDPKARLASHQFPILACSASQHQPDFAGVDMKGAGVPLDMYCQDAFDRLVKGGEDESMYEHSAAFLAKIGVHQRAFVNLMPVKKTGKDT